MCVLVRLQAFSPPLPDSLQSLLGDVSVIKAGVGIDQDKMFLETDYGLLVQGCVDLRLVLLCCLESGGVEKATGKVTPSLGLAALAFKFLGRTLDKDWQVRTSDWEAETLTKRQQNYAAEDALAGVQVLLVACSRVWQCGKVAETWWLPWLPPPFFHHSMMVHIHQTCHHILDHKFSTSASKLLQLGEGCASQQQVTAKISKTSRAYCPRKTPLYHNCQLLAPDGVPLCTCDPKKAQWYLEKGLGVAVQQQPLVVRLNFEPASRPREEYKDEQYYVQERHNLCVVCGQGHSYIKKNVVPHEYRRHFPTILKDHQSHDVVLLCVHCHQVSNAHDATLRELLATECSAPTGQASSRRVTVNTQRRAVKNAAGALLRTRFTIPQPRITELENVVKKFFNVDSLTHELLQEAANIDPRDWNEDFQAHGEQVCETYRSKGLVQLQHRWRRHFLNTMQPQHLPQYWSVSHNLHKLCCTMARLTSDHPDHDTYNLILLGTDGNEEVQRMIEQCKEASVEDICGDFAH
ncbi:exonuclease 3'-5' domain-containing protein 2-like isoform X2 [Portunus trituberculatus]|uniref:Exonuclease 3'-5' domain-containing protein 2 n=2 Tax=Portunus trituberculatus TaxID=210409 RepID=A0A5B7EM28_PORTR|nr:exonuclease 3'-5' domain-containing protein 2-like isoform X2 [Portunus trituberculatus]MPC34103.1 Exonuclease 3'-5' domain-containing protein 2 [Portunus trituberculatus]